MDDLGVVGEKVSLLLDLGKYREAARLAGEAVGREPRWAEGFGQLAQAYAGLGELDTALAAARDGVQRDPQSAWGFYVLAAVQQRRGELAEALAANDQALRLNPEWAAAFGARSAILSALGRPQAALRAADEALRLDPDSWQSARHRVWCLHGVDRTADAVAFAEWARSRHPTQPEFPHYLGWVELEWAEVASFDQAFGHYARADAHFREVLRLAPGEPTYVADRRRATRSAGRDLAKIWAAVTVLPAFLLATPTLADARFFERYWPVVQGLLVGSLVYFGIFVMAIFREGAVQATMPRLGLGVPRAPLSPRQYALGRGFWVAWPLLGLVWFAFQWAVVCFSPR